MADRDSFSRSVRPEHRASAAERAESALTRYLEHAGQDGPKPAGLTRRIALLALYLHVRKDASLQDALDAAAGIHEGRPGLSVGYLRKSKSEARAVIDVLIASATLPEARLDSGAFFGRLEGLLDTISFDQATRSRAHALRGTRGGRRSKERPQLVLQGLIQLKQRSDHGDAAAAEELAAVRALLDEWDAGG